MSYMYFEPTEYCLVCKNYRADLKHCEKGWEQTFCEEDDFQPDIKTAVLNFLYYLYIKGTNITTLDDIENEIENYIKAI